MKKIFLILFIFASALAQIRAEDTIWLLPVEKTPSAEQTYDVFYVYPTLTADKDRPLMDISVPETKEKAIGFSEAQTSMFRKNARIFAPFVRQLEFGRCKGFLSGDGSDPEKVFADGLGDTKKAFLDYLKNYNNGRPYILFGHSQGSMDLYMMMKNTPEVSAARGFAAAYLIGLPRITKENILEDFKGRGILPASGEKDTSVIVVWNTQAPGSKNPVFTVKNGYVINPLNWKTDSTPGAPALNIKSYFYDYRTGKGVEKENFCGAYADPENGALIVDLPADSDYDAHGFMGRGVFHMNDVWFFAYNLSGNAKTRTDALVQSARK